MTLNSYGEAPPGVDTGRYFWTSDAPLGSIDVSPDDPNDLRFQGNRLVLTGRFETAEELVARIESTYLALPLLLNVDLIDAPLVARVSGTVGVVPFDWVFGRVSVEFDGVDKDLQEQRITVALGRLPLLQNRRMLGALHYFRQACRLERAGHTPFEFTADILLNLCKVLEVLFPGEHTRDAAREGLSALGYSHDEIEKDFIDVMRLRSKFDVAHVSLAIFSPDQRTTLQQVAEGAEARFRDLIRRVCDGLARGDLEIPEPEGGDPQAEVLRILEEFRQRQAE